MTDTIALPPRLCSDTRAFAGTAPPRAGARGATSSSTFPTRRFMPEVKTLAGRYNGLTAELLAHLAEVDARGIYRERACSSLYTYCVYELRLSEDEAQRRARAARTARTFPVLFEMLAEGAIHLTGLLLLAPYLTAENHAELLARARFRTKREIEHLVAEIAPRPDVPARIEPLGPRPRSSRIVASVHGVAAGAGARARARVSGRARRRRHVGGDATLVPEARREPRFRSSRVREGDSGAVSHPRRRGWRIRRRPLLRSRSGRSATGWSSRRVSGTWSSWRRRGICSSTRCPIGTWRGFTSSRWLRSSSS